MRAALTDLCQYEAPPGGYDNRFEHLTPAEQKAEQLCEQERYYSLYHNDVEEEIYQGMCAIIHIHSLGPFDPWVERKIIIRNAF